MQPSTDSESTSCIVNHQHHHRQQHTSHGGILPHTVRHTSFMIKSTQSRRTRLLHCWLSTSSPKKTRISPGRTVTYITYDKVHTIPASPMAAISDVCGSVWVSAGVCEVCAMCAEVCAVCAVSVCECVFVLPFVNKSQALSTIILPKPSKTKKQWAHQHSSKLQCREEKKTPNPKAPNFLTNAILDPHQSPPAAPRSRDPKRSTTSAHLERESFIHQSPSAFNSLSLAL